MTGSGLRLLIIGDYPLNEGLIIGGVQAVTSTLAHALAAHDEVQRVTVLSLHHGHISQPFRKIHDKLHILYIRRQPALTIFTRSVLDVWHTRRIAASISPQLVHGQGIGRSGYIATKLRIPAVVTVHGLVHLEARLTASPSLPARLRATLIDQMVRHVFQHAQLVISSSTYDAHSLAGLIQGQHTIIPNPIAPVFFMQPQNPSQEKQVVFAGLLHHRKNLEGLLRAFSRVHRHIADARLLIVGPDYDPQYTQALKLQAAALQLGDSVRFVGHVAMAELLQIMSACRVLALFSHEETLPTVIAQALALGKPVIASQVGGIAEMIVDGENGFLVDPGDEATFAERLITLLERPALCRSMGERGQQLAQQRFAPAVIAQCTIDAYRMIR